MDIQLDCRSEIILARLGRVIRRSGCCWSRTAHSIGNSPGTLPSMARSEVERAHLGMWGGSFKEPSRYRACRVVSERIPDAWGVIDAAAKQAPAKVRVEGSKWILDGTPIEQNSLQRKAYGNQPGWRGRSNFTDAQLREILEAGSGTTDATRAACRRRCRDRPVAEDDGTACVGFRLA